jgi:choline dehydrogenase-like flavoprotein
MDTDLTPQERLLRGVLIALGLFFVISMGYYLSRGLGGDADYGFVANSVTKDGLFLAITLLAVANMVRFGWLTVLVILGHAMLSVLLLTMIVFGHTWLTTIEPPLGLGDTAFAWAWFGIDVVIVVALSLMYTAALRARHKLKFLSPNQYQAVEALSEVLIKDDHRRLTPERIAHNVDDYLHAFRASSKRKIKILLGFLAVYPLLTFHLPFSAMEPDARLRFVKKRFMTEGGWVVGRWWRRNMQLVIGAAAQLVYLGYYGDKKTFKSINYTPFSVRRPEHAVLEGVISKRSEVSAMEPDDVVCDTLEADVVIVGSGAAGAILAYELADAGKEVLILERGEHVDPSDFSEDEREMLSRLYADGAVQLSRDFRFAVLQGSCVGGSTVVNNAVCIEIPPPILKLWNDPSCLDAGIEEGDLWDSFKHIAEWLPVTLQDHAPSSLGAQRFIKGVEGMGLDKHVKTVYANIENCLGCGYCNIGCKFDKKLSMLQNVLPRAQKDFPDQVRILSQCHADRIETVGNRAEAVLCTLGDGDDRRTVRIHARQGVVVSAGTIASSLLLQRSSIGGSLVGKHLSFNMGTPLTAHFDEKLCSYDGLQISHYVAPPKQEDLVIETWFNPPATQSLFMPGWFEEHYRNMSEYDEMACAGVVVGTQRNGEARHKRLRGDFGFTPQRADLEKLIAGIKLTGKIFFEAGATRVMPSTFRYHEITNAGELDDALDGYIDDPAGLFLNSAHPQGGNAISRDENKGVVDENFCVRGLENVYLCDASVFPSSITVNPQYTVMALAHYGGRRIAARLPSKKTRRPAHVAVAATGGAPEPVGTPEGP